MIATISKPSHHTGMQDYSHHMLSLTANTAGDPLPLPRRPQSHSPSWSLPPSNPSLSASSTSCRRSEPTIMASPSIVTITPATPPKTESESDTSSQRRCKRRKKDVRVPNPTALYPPPPELSAPMPTLRTPCAPLGATWAPISKNSASANETTTPRAPIVYTPGMSIGSRRKTSDVGLSLHSAQSLRPSPSVSESLSSSSSLSSVSVASTPNTPLIRKKSGQVVRPSLKSSSSYSASRCAANLDIMSPNLSLPSSKSEPVTPFRATTPTSSKAVHFDENLERVKLFLTQQKPLAVSTEGSPVDTDDGETSASGAENNEISRFFGPVSFLGGPDKKSTPKLLMHTNIPSRTLSLPPPTTDVALESLLLARGDKSIHGSVLVRNLAFDKSVTARFSFDGWCTRSEVNGRWKAGVGSTRDGRFEWDRFEFVIWLGDLKLGEEKSVSRKLELAVRYRVASRGLEQWDNNGGRNYVATFERRGLLEERERGRKTRLKKKVQAVPFSDDELSDLLEKVATSKTTRKSRSTSPTPMSFHHSAPASPTPTKAAVHARTRSFPLPSSPSSELMYPAYGWRDKSPPLPPIVSAGKASPIFSPMKTASPTLGSPRDLDDTFHSHIKFPTMFSNDSEGSGGDSRPEGMKMRRHHQRGGGGGYFDLSTEHPQESRISRKHTIRGPAEPGTPTPPSSRFHSYPPLRLTFRDSSRSPSGDRQTLINVEDSQVQLSDRRPKNIGPPPPAPPSTPEEYFFPPQSSADDTSDSSSTSTLLENDESPPSSRSSTPPLEEEEERGLGLHRTNDNDDDRELYRDFLNKFCFFTGPGSPGSLSNKTTRLDEIKNLKTNESSSESSTPTITPSGSI